MPSTDRINELERTLAQQTRFVSRMLTQSAVTRILSSSGNDEGGAVRGVLQTVCENLKWAVGVYWKVDAQADVLRCAQLWPMDSSLLQSFLDATKTFVFSRGMGLPGRVWTSGSAASPTDAATRAADLHTAVACPVVAHGNVNGVLEFYSHEQTAPDTDLIAVLTGIGMQLGQYLSRINAEEALRLSEASFRLLAESAPDPIVGMNERGRVVFANPATTRVFGYAQTELNGASMEMLVAPEMRAGLKPYLQTGGREVPVEGLEVQGLQKSGTRVDLEISFSGFHAPGGLRVIVAFIRDVTGRRNLERQLKRKQEHLELALDAGHMGTWEWVVATGQVIWSEGLERLHGREPGGFPGTLDAVVEEMHPEDRDRVSRTIQSALSTGHPYHVEYRIVTPAREIRWLEAFGRVIYGADGAPERMLGVCADITERKAPRG